MRKAAKNSGGQSARPHLTTAKLAPRGSGKRPAGRYGGRASGNSGRVIGRRSGAHPLLRAGPSRESQHLPLTSTHWPGRMSQVSVHRHGALSLGWGRLEGRTCSHKRKRRRGVPSPAALQALRSGIRRYLLHGFAMQAEIETIALDILGHTAADDEIDHLVDDGRADRRRPGP